MENKMSLKKFFKNKSISFILLIGILLNSVIWIIFWLNLDLNEMSLVVHYNSFFGIDKFSVNSTGNRLFEIFFVPFVGLLILFINYFLGGFLVYSGWKKVGEEKFKKISSENFSTSMIGGFLILITGVSLQLVILVYSIAIVLVNR